MIKILTFFTAFTIFFSSPTLAESGPLGWGEASYKQELETDRPDFTEGTQTIQPGHVQFELGYTFSKDDENQVDTEEHTLPEILTRIGLIEDLELRLAWAGYSSLEIEDSKSEGVTDFSIGFKHRMYYQDGLLPHLSFLGELIIPSGSSDFTSDEVEVAGKFLWAYEFSDFSLAGNLNFSTPIGEEGRYLEIGNSVALACGITNNVGTYFEYFGLYPAEDVVETTEHSLNGGFTFAVNENIQLDIRAGFGLNDPATDFFTGAGIVLRL